MLFGILGSVDGALPSVKSNENTQRGYSVYPYSGDILLVDSVDPPVSKGGEQNSGAKGRENTIPESTMIFNIIKNSDLTSLTEADIKVYREILKEFMENNPDADKKEIAASLLEFIGSDRNTQHWKSLISSFVRGFTFYGLLVLLAIFCYRMARALFDQAERLKDRRHAMRQGRLFVHLNGGKMSIDEMEKAFNWNMSSDNAFANINTDAQAPWGLVVKDMLKTLRETAKAGIKAAERK
jgi:hypothetical protein